MVEGPNFWQILPSSLPPNPRSHEAPRRVTAFFDTLLGKIRRFIWGFGIGILGSVGLLDATKTSPPTLGAICSGLA